MRAILLSDRLNGDLICIAIWCQYMKQRAIENTFLLTPMSTLGAISVDLALLQFDMGPLE